MSHHLTTCTFCGVGCGIYLETSRGAISGTYPSMSHPANHGRICVRGWHVHEIAGSPERITTPMVRKNGTLVPVSFEEAYDTIATRLGEIRKQHGADSIGFLGSSRCANEDGYVFQKFARTVIGTNNVDQGTSLHRSTTVEVLREMLGVPAATNSLDCISRSKVLVINELDVGTQSPTIGGHIIRAKLDGAKLIVVGERRHRIAEHADIFLNIKPGTSSFLYAAMAKIIIDRGLVNLDFIRGRCKGYEEFLKNIQSFDILVAARRCDVDPEQIERAALVYAQNQPGMILYGAGAEVTGRDAIAAIVNLTLLCGNLGVAGAGIMPLAEHNNAQGGCDMGVLPSYLPGYAPVADQDGRSRLEKLWGATLPPKPGLDAIGMFSAPRTLKALWLDRHNPIVSASYRDAAEVLQAMDFVVLQNLFMTQTAQYAHVVLPVAAFGEEDVTFTSTERRIQRAVKAITPPADLPSAWQEIAEVARRMGSSWKYSSSADVLAEIARAVPQYSGVTLEGLSRDYGKQWPCTHDEPMGTPVLFADGVQAQRFAFASLRIAPPEEAATKEFPFTLAFEQSHYYWNQNTLVRHSETLTREYGILLMDFPEGFVEVNDTDAKGLSIRDGQRIKIVSTTGESQTFARVTSEVRRGIVCVPFMLPDVMKAMGWDKRSGRAANMHVRIEKAG